MGTDLLAELRSLRGGEEASSDELLAREVLGELLAALALLLTTLRISRGRYWGAAESLIFKGYPAAATLWSQWGIRRQGEEGYFASTSEGGLQVHLAFSGYLLYAAYGGMDQVGWATFVDGRLVRAKVDEGEFLRAVLCWAVPGWAGTMVRCS